MDNIISSFYVKDSLNSEIWDNSDNIEESKMKPENKGRFVRYCK